MAEEQALAAETSPVPSDLKRKFQDLEEPEAPQQPIDQQHPESNANSNSDEGEKKPEELAADAGGSPAVVARGLSSAQAAAGSEQIQIQVPNEKVGLIIGRGGETVKGLQTKSGARIQAVDILIPQHLADGDDSKERTVQVTGDKRQVEVASEMIKEVMSQDIQMARNNNRTVILYRNGTELSDKTGVKFRSTKPIAMKLPEKTTFESLKLLIRQKFKLPKHVVVSEIIYRTPLSLNPLNYGFIYLDDEESVQIMFENHERFSQHVDFIELCVRIDEGRRTRM